jgi:MoxR-like ATPase
MAFLAAQEREQVENIAKLVFCNPFTPEWINYQRRALGAEFKEGGQVWSSRTGSPEDHVNLAKLEGRVTELAETLRGSLANGAQPSQEELALYEGLITFLLYVRCSERFRAENLATFEGDLTRRRIGYYKEFADQAHHYLSAGDRTFGQIDDLPHLFACFFQIRRAFHYIFAHIVGGSLPGARLRAAAWQSIFTHDIRRYRRSLFRHMGEVTTLITGPSGSGKDLVARAIAMARYVPFDPHRCAFRENFLESFHALSLSALSPTLIESELFGHRKGAFTGALEDRVGWLEACSPSGTVFLDEIGDLEGSIQIKLLRVLENRIFHRLGETRPRNFRGKIIAATNCDLTGEIAGRRFRADLYYRLCADEIRTPSLAERLADDPGELRTLVLYIARQAAGDAEAETVAAEVEEYIRRNLGMDYPWPGNIRELAQCVRNILVRREYRPTAVTAPGAAEGFLADVAAGRLGVEELLRRYSTLVFARAGTYEEAARRLGTDRRTVKSRVDPQFLAELQARPGADRGP